MLLLTTSVARADVRFGVVSGIVSTDISEMLYTERRIGPVIGGVVQVNSENHRAALELGLQHAMKLVDLPMSHWIFVDIEVPVFARLRFPKFAGANLGFGIVYSHRFSKVETIGFNEYDLDTVTRRDNVAFGGAVGVDHELGKHWLSLDLRWVKSIAPISEGGDERGNSTETTAYLLATLTF